MDRFKSPEFRAAVYGVFAALALVASVAGVLDEQMIAAILGVISAGIGLLALFNTPTAKKVAAAEAKSEE
jgi:2-methylcitrate dehydratase PrpD